MDYAYDGNGNLSQKITTLTTDDGSDSTTLNYTFDARGELQQITSGGSSIGQFLYDSHGQRLRARFNDDSGTQIAYRHSLYQGLNLTSQYDVSDTDSYSLNANYRSTLNRNRLSAAKPSPKATTITTLRPGTTPMC